MRLDEDLYTGALLSVAHDRVLNETVPCSFSLSPFPLFLT